MNKEIKEIKYFLCSALLLISLAACSSPTKATSESVTDASKEKTTQLTEDERDIFDNGYKIGEYTFYLTKQQKENAEFRENILSRMDEMTYRYDQQKLQINLNKKINLFVHGMTYDKESEEFNLNCFFMNTSGEDIKKIKFSTKPKFKTVPYEEWIEFEGTKDNIGLFPNNSFFTVDISGHIPKENYPELSKNTAKDIQIEIKDLEINGQKVENTKMKKFLLFLSFVLLLFSEAGCAKNSSKVEKQQLENNYTKEEQKIIDEGYKIDDYHFYVMNFYKDKPKDIKEILDNFNNFVVENFKNNRNKINKELKVNIIPYNMDYFVNTERLRIGYFLINTSNETIKSVDFSGKPVFNNIPENEVSSSSFSLSEKDFVNLPPKGFVMFSINIEAPIEYKEKLEKNAPANFAYKIETLEINGKKVDNQNE